MSLPESVDVAVIGAGVVGALTARELSRFQASVCLIERDEEPSAGASKANSGIVHAGYDAEEGSMKARFNVEGNRMMEGLCRELHVPYRRTGSLVLSFEPEDDETLRGLKARGDANGVPGLEIWSAERVLREEPHVNPAVRGGLYAPTGGVVSPYELACAAAENAVDNGVIPLFGTTVTAVERAGNGEGGLVVRTDRGELRARFVVNCAGGMADRFMEGTLSVHPRKGEYILLDKCMGGYVRHVLFQPPSKAGKGVLAAPTTHGNLLLGPTADEAVSPDDVETTAAGEIRVRQAVRRTLPELGWGTIITHFAGERASTSWGDFYIRPSEDRPGLIHAAGIDSPGLTASPAIAAYLTELLREQGADWPVKPTAFVPRRPPIHMNKMTPEERDCLIQRDPTYGRIVCRCEGISEGEIRDAIRRHAGPRTADGVKRRVRAGMGRCQGGFCLPAVLEILAQETGIAPLLVTKRGGNSWLLAWDKRDEAGGEQLRTSRSREEEGA